MNHWVLLGLLTLGGVTKAQMIQKQLHQESQPTPALVRAHKCWWPGVYYTACKQLTVVRVSFSSDAVALKLCRQFSWFLFFPGSCSGLRVFGCMASLRIFLIPLLVYSWEDRTQWLWLGSSTSKSCLEMFTFYLKDLVIVKVL